MSANDHDFADGSRKQLVNAHTRNLYASRRLLLQLESLEHELSLKTSRISCNQRMISKELRDMNPRKYDHKGVVCPLGLSYEDRELYKSMTRSNTQSSIMTLADFDNEFKGWRMQSRRQDILEDLNANREQTDTAGMSTEMQIREALEFVRKAELELCRHKLRLKNMKTEHLPSLNNLKLTLSLSRQRTILNDVALRLPKNQPISPTVKNDRIGFARDDRGRTRQDKRESRSDGHAAVLPEIERDTNGKVILSSGNIRIGERSAYIETPGKSKRPQYSKGRFGKGGRHRRKLVHQRSISMPELVNKVDDLKEGWDKFKPITTKTLQDSAEKGFPAIKTKRVDPGDNSHSLPSTFWRRLPTFHHFSKYTE